MPSTNNSRGCLGALFGLFGGGREGQGNPNGHQNVNYPYHVRDDFLSAAELSFYRVLTNIVGTNAAILTKVGLSDLFYVHRPNENRSAFGRIAQRHVDFLVCDPQTMKPLVGIELDDSSHRRGDGPAKDEFLDQVFSAASLPLVRFRVQQAYQVADVSEKIRAYIGVPGQSRMEVSLEPEVAPSGTGPERAGTAGATVPSCPKCGESMVLRPGTQGRKPFYGCPNYPRCRGMVRIDVT